jgi:hypothetical protein
VRQRRSASPPSVDAGISSKVSRPFASCSPRGGCATTSSGATPETGFGARGSRATAGPRTSAAAPATRTPPCSDRTSSSRARSRTTVATTGT